MEGRRSERGITFGEVLISAAVLFVLALVLFPWYGNFGNRHTTPQVACLSNVKQIALGTLLYAVDRDDKMPLGPEWMDRIAVDESVLHETEGVEKGGYGRALRKRLTGVKLATVSEPDRIVMIFDSTLIGRNAVGELWSLPRPGRHRDHKSDSMAFADGHARVGIVVIGDGQQQSDLDKKLMEDEAAWDSKK